MSVSHSTAVEQVAVGRDLSPAAEDRRLRLFLLGCGVAAIGVSAVAQALAPPQGDPIVTWLVAVVVPALIILLVVATPDRKPWLLRAAAVLIYVEAILLATIYVIGIAFAIVLPMIGIAIVQGHVRGWAKLAAYLGAVIVSTTAVALAELGVPPNDLGTAHPVLPVTAFALVAGFALGLTWHASERYVEALQSADREITARAEAEELLSGTARFLEQLINSSPVPTLALEADGRVSVWNPAAERLFGWSASEVVGAQVPFASGAEEATLREQVERALRGKASFGEVVHSETRDGRPILVEVHAASRRGHDDARLGVIVQAIDVTARSELEAQLRQAQKMEAIGHLAGGIAHDMNNTLTAVGGFAQLIEDDSTDEDVRADAAQISAAVRRASQLTTQLLAFARRSVLQPETIEVSPFVAAMRPMVQRLLGADIDIVLRDEAPGATIRVDPGAFEQALLNLAINARDAMPTGGTLTITSARRAGAPPTASTGAVARPGTANSVLVSVSDTGVGIPPEVQEQVFEPFFTTKPQGKGTGLGLAMVYGFVTQSGGAISLRSAPGAGTTIEIELPEAGDAPALAPVEVSSPQRGKETILLVEDEPSVASFGVRVLERLGYVVLDARDGSQALEIARSHRGPISLILTDVIMPGQTGPEVVKAVRELHPEAAVLYASGYAADAIADRGVLPPGVDLLQKPYTSNELAGRVRSALDRREARPRRNGIARA